MSPIEFATLIGGLISCTAHKMEKRDIEIWRRHLADLPDDALRVAFARACAECKAFPSVALIREYAAEAQHGSLPSHGEAFGRMMKAVRCFGACANCIPHCGDACVAHRAERYVGPIVWRAIRSLGGWPVVCDSSPGERGTLRGQFRMVYEPLASREAQMRSLPEHARPKIDGHSATASLPTAEGRKLIEQASLGLKSAEEGMRKRA